MSFCKDYPHPLLTLATSPVPRAESPFPPPIQLGFSSPSFPARLGSSSPSSPGPHSTVRGAYSLRGGVGTSGLPGCPLGLTCMLSVKGLSVEEHHGRCVNRPFIATDASSSVKPSQSSNHPLEQPEALSALSDSEVLG